MLLEGRTQKEIHEHLVHVHGAGALSKSSVHRWVSRIQKEGPNVQDKPKTGQKPTRQMAQQKVQDIIQQDKRSTIREIIRKAEVSVGTAHKIVKSDLALKKKPAKWIPHLLTLPQKLQHLMTSRTALAMMRATRQCPAIRRVVTQDESWFHTWDPESKAASMQWLRTGEKRPKKVRHEISIPKSMLVVFFDQDGIIYREFIPRGCGINRHLYRDILERFRQTLHRKRLLLWTNTLPWVLLQDGAPTHTAGSTMDYLNYHSIKTLPHPVYSPDLNPCDYWLFKRVKKEVQGIRHRTIAELKLAMDCCLENIPKEEFAAAMDRLQPRLQKCVDTRGSYFKHD